MNNDKSVTFLEKTQNLFYLNKKPIIITVFPDLDRFVDGRVELQLLCPLGGLESDNQVGDGLSVTADRILGLDRTQLGHLAFVNFLRFLDPESDRAPEIFHQNFGLLDLGAEDFGAHHRTEGNLENKIKFKTKSC